MVVVVQDSWRLSSDDPLSLAAWDSIGQSSTPDDAISRVVPRFDSAQIGRNTSTTSLHLSRPEDYFAKSFGIEPQTLP